MAHLVVCTERMLRCADEGDWTALELLAQERSESMSACFGPGNGTEPSEAGTESIAALLVLNDRLVQRVAAARSAVMDEIASLRHGRGSRDSYSEIQGLRG